MPYDLSVVNGAYIFTPTGTAPPAPAPTPTPPAPTPICDALIEWIN